MHHAIATLRATLVLACGLCLLWAGAVDAAGRVYRVVDEDGNVVFTDVPPATREQDASVDVPEPNSFDPVQAGAIAPEEDRLRWGEEAAEGEGKPVYRRLGIVSPADDASVRQNAGNVTVEVALEPGLSANHRLQLLLDGAPVETGKESRFELTNVDRGTHSLTARVLDQSGAAVIESEPSVFHLQRYSILNAPNRPKPAPTPSGSGGG